MTLLGLFMGLVAALIAISAVRREREKATAYAFVFAGLAIMLATWGYSSGWIAFAVWTAVSYLILNFPLASTLYLGSSFCYLLGLWGVDVYSLQVVSNVAGLLGLLAVWHGRPRWKYVGNERPSHWGALSLAFDIARGRARVACPNEERRG